MLACIASAGKLSQSLSVKGYTEIIVLICFSSYGLDIILIGGRCVASVVFPTNLFV